MATPELPHCDDLFRQFFDRWYDDADRKRKGFPDTRPDLLTCPDFAGHPAGDITSLHPTDQKEVRHRIATMLKAAQ